MGWPGGDGVYGYKDMEGTQGAIKSAGVTLAKSTGISAKGR